MTDVMELSDYKTLLSDYLAGNAEISDQQKFDFLDVFFNCLADMKTSVFPIPVMKQFAKDLGDPVYGGHPISQQLDAIL